MYKKCLGNWIKSEDGLKQPGLLKQLLVMVHTDDTAG